MRAILGPSVLVALLSCNQPQSRPEAAPAKAEAPLKTAADEEAEKRREARERQKKAEKEAEKAREDQIDALAALPDPLPKNLAKACDGMVKAYDRYMQKVLTGDMLIKWRTGGNEIQVGIFKRECLKKSVEVAACQTNGLDKMSPEKREDLPELMKRCVDKFGGEKATAP